MPFPPPLLLLLLLTLLHHLFTPSHSICPPILCRRQTLPHTPLSRQQTTPTTPSCTLTPLGPTTRKLLQLNGTADDQLHFSLCPATLSHPNLVLVDHSSDPQVLSLLDNDRSDVLLDRLTSPSTHCQNISATFSFDRMVGLVDYTLSVINQSQPFNHTLCSAKVSFIVAGLTVYEQTPIAKSSQTFLRADSSSPNSTNVILSGESNEIITEYNRNLIARINSFKLKLQFPDGSSSNTRPQSFVNSALANLKTRANTDQTSPISFDNTHCQNIVNLDAENNTKCAAAIRTAQHSVPDSQPATDIFLNLAFEPYKDGLVAFLFEWPELTSGDPILADEEFVNVLFISVIGDPPPIVHQIHPNTLFRRAGGERLTLVMDNTEGSNHRNIRVGNFTFEEIPGSYRKRADGLYEASFLTHPGNGTDLEWRLYISFPEGRTRLAKLIGVGVSQHVSYIDTPLHITVIDPAAGKPGDIVTLTGYFDGFDPENPDHDVFFSQKTLRALGITPRVSADGTSLSFLIPERHEVGTAYNYQIRVVVNDETTASVTFSYIPDGLSMDINVYGASYNETFDEYQIGTCSVTRFVALLPPGVSEPESFSWSVIDMKDPSGQNLLSLDSNIKTNGKSLLLLPKAFGNNEGQFEVIVTSSVNGQALTSFLVVRKLPTPIIGVTLSQPLPRSIALPDVPVRVSAIVIPPRSDCYRHSSKIIYKWSYRDVTHEFSYRNFSTAPMNESSTPARLGREYVIPQSSLAIGNSTVSLTAYMEDDPSVSGSASTSLSIYPAPLVPIIGYGASEILHSTASDLTITAEKSYNPDSKYLGIDSDVNTYVWDCKISHFANMSDAQECDGSLLPSKEAISFTVGRTSLRRMKEKLSIQGEPVAYAIRYSLRVGARSLLSLRKSQVVEISPDEYEVAKLDDLRVQNNRGEDVDWLKIQSFSDILIAPDGTEVSWRFRVLSPASQSLIFDKVGNLIIHPGYFDPTLRSVAQVLPLGVKGGTFAHAQEYEISITISSKKPGVEPGEAKVALRTQDEPILVLPELPIVYGDAETMFTAYAQINLDATHDFLYFFYLVRGDGDEFCLDGCSGRSVVQFKLTEAGDYRILVRLMDIQGKSLLDEAYFLRNVSVSDTSFQVSALSDKTTIGHFESMLRDVHYQGDHATFELLVSSLTNMAQKDGGAVASEEDVKALDLAVDAMHQIVQNSAPTTMSSKSYVKIACRLASVGPEFSATDETMYTVLSMVDKAITHVPVSEAFDLVEELLAFYNVSAKNVVTALAKSSARVRLVQFGPDSGLDTKSLLVDLYRLQEEHLTTVLARDAQCGMVRRLSTVVPQGVPPSEINDFVVSKRALRSRSNDNPLYFDILGSYEDFAQRPTHTAFTLAVLCNPDQASGIRGEATSFEWCDRVFTESGITAKDGAYKLDPHQKRLFSIMETLDFVWLSGLGEDDTRTDGNFLVTTNVTNLGDDGLTLLALPEIPNCYSVNTSMVRLGVTPAKGCLSVDGYMIQNLGWPFEPNLEKNGFRKNFTAVSSALSRDRSSTVLLKSSKPGVFGLSGQDCPINARKPTLALPDTGDTTFVYYVFGVCAMLLLLLVATWTATSFAHAKYLQTPV